MSDTRRINARKAAVDFRSGMSDAELMDRFKVSAKGLQNLARKLVDAGLLNQAELNTRFITTRTAGEAWTCPACGMPSYGESFECPNCGVILAKIRARKSVDIDAKHNFASSGDGKCSVEAAPAAIPIGLVQRIPLPEEECLGGTGGSMDESEDAYILEPRSLEQRDGLIVGAGAALALILFAVPWTNHILSVFIILVHEMGHCIFGWLFGYPSAPAFDIMWGGGVTLHLERSTALAFLIYPLLAGLIYAYRKNTATVAALSALGAVHALINYSRFHSVIILFMGHGTELIIAGLFIYRALSGRSVIHTAERPLYALVGFFVIFFDLSFAYSLITDASYRAHYGMAKGGQIEMDFVRIATEYLHTNLVTVVRFFFICCLLTPLLAYLAFRYEQYIHWLIARLWVRDPAELQRA